MTFQNEHVGRGLGFIGGCGSRFLILLLTGILLAFRELLMTVLATGLHARGTAMMVRIVLVGMVLLLLLLWGYFLKTLPTRPLLEHPRLDRIARVSRRRRTPTRNA